MLDLVPTPFHRELRDALAEHEPGLFRWYSSDRYEAERADRLRLEILRSSYRLSPDTHERPHRLAREAAARLGVEVPIVLYQLHHGESANAGLCFLPAEAHVSAKRRNAVRARSGGPSCGAACRRFDSAPSWPCGPSPG
jgi:hypothetical protein